MTELMELMNFNVAVKGININLHVIYKPPNGSVIRSFICNMKRPSVKQSMKHK